MEVISVSEESPCPAHIQVEDQGKLLDDCDICTSTAQSESEAVEAVEPKSESAVVSEGGRKVFELAECVDSGEETSDEDDDQEINQFLQLMNKAERKNVKKVCHLLLMLLLLLPQASNIQIINLGSSTPSSNWRKGQMEDDDDDDDDYDDDDYSTEDEDDSAETTR